MRFLKQFVAREWFELCPPSLCWKHTIILINVLKKQHWRRDADCHTRSLKRTKLKKMWEYDPNRRDCVRNPYKILWKHPHWFLSLWIHCFHIHNMMVKVSNAHHGLKMTDLRMLESLFFCCSIGWHSPSPWGFSSSFIFDSLSPFFLFSQHFFSRYSLFSSCCDVFVLECHDMKDTNICSDNLERIIEYNHRRHLRFSFQDRNWATVYFPMNVISSVPQDSDLLTRLKRSGISSFSFSSVALDPFLCVFIYLLCRGGQELVIILFCIILSYYSIMSWSSIPLLCGGLILGPFIIIGEQLIFMHYIYIYKCTGPPTSARMLYHVSI